MASTPTETTQQLKFAESLRQLAEFYETHPDAPVPTYPRIDIFASSDPAEAKRQFRSFGAFEKEHLDSWFVAYKQFGELRIELNAKRETVCRKVVVGTREIPEHIVPAQPETIIPAHTEEITEWQCEPILAGASA